MWKDFGYGSGLITFAGIVPHREKCRAVGAFGNTARIIYDALLSYEPEKYIPGKEFLFWTEN